MLRYSSWKFHHGKHSQQDFFCLYAKRLTNVPQLVPPPAWHSANMFAQGLLSVMQSTAFVTLSYLTGFVSVRFSRPVDHAALLVNTVLPAVMVWVAPLERVSNAIALEQLLPA